MKFMNWLYDVLDEKYTQWVYLGLMVLAVFLGREIGVIVAGVFWLEARAVLLLRTKLVLRVEETPDRKMTLHTDCCES